MRYLVWVSVEVKILQETSSKFTEQEIVRVIDGPQTPIGVIVGTCACTEWTHWGREGTGVGEEGRGEEGIENKGYYNNVPKQIIFTVPALENI